jgi:hypothetical protein
VGDLLVLIVHPHSDIYDANGGNPLAITCPGFTESYVNKTSFTNGFQFFGWSVRHLIKEATAADVAASTFTVSATLNGQANTRLGAAVLLRVTGAGSNNGLFAAVGENSRSQDQTFAFTDTIPRFGDSLVIATSGINNNDDDDVVGASGYTVTSTEANPTWTEITKQFHHLKRESSGSVLSVAYVTTQTSDDISGFSLVSDGSNEGDNRHAASFLVINAPRNAQGTAELVSVATDTSNTTAVSVGVSGNHAPATASNSLFAQTVTAIRNRWNIQTKPAARSYTLVSKPVVQAYSLETRPELDIPELNTVTQRRSNRVYMSGMNKIYRAFKERRWTNQTRP